MTLLSGRPIRIQGQEERCGTEMNIIIGEVSSMVRSFLVVQREPEYCGPSDTVPGSSGRISAGFWEGMRFWAATSIVTAALTIMLCGFVTQVAPRNGQNFDTFLGYRTNMEYITISVGNGVDIDLDASWRPRILSRVFGGAITADSLEAGQINSQLFASRVGLWVAGWFVAIAIVAVLGAGRFGLVFILGTFCGVLYAIQPGADPRVFPWDMPALFFFTLATMLWMRDRPLWFLPLLPVAVLFKETAIVLAFGYLFVKGGRTRRLVTFCVALLLAGGSKVIVDVVTSSAGGLIMTHRLLLLNIQEGLRSPLLLLSNAGLTICALLLMPWHLRQGRALGLIAVLFTVGIMTLAVAAEVRIWFEMIPLGLFGVTFRLKGRNNAPPD